MSSKRKTRFFESYDDNFSETKDQDFVLPENYKWIRCDRLSRFLSAVIYSAAIVFSSVYCPLFLHLRFKGRDKIKSLKNSGAFIYGNHTQPLGDVFTPALAAFPKRIYTVVSPANFGIPVIGKILPFLGALPISDTIHGMKEFSKAVTQRLDENKVVVIYPEAHVWEYCSFIRPFSESSFKFPLKNKKPVYCMTVTYQKRRFFKKPAMIVYIDGPFEYKTDGNSKKAAAELRDAVYDCMCERSKLSNSEYIRYEKKAHDEVSTE